MMPTPGEYSESRSRLFASVCWVVDQYRIEEGVIVPFVGGKPVSPTGGPSGAGPPYLPLARPELPGEFSRLERGDDVLVFVHRYGLLGYNHAFRFLELAGAVVGKLHRPLPGDPLSWVLAHARTVKLVMELAEALEDQQRLTSRVEELLVRDEVLSYTVARRGLLRPSQTQHRYDGDSRKTALEIIALTLNGNLEGISRGFVVESTGPPQPRPMLSTIFEPQNLLDCIYWLVADAVQDQTIHQCPHCQRLFVAQGKMKYCPPVLGQEVSSCMNRAKQQTFRHRRQALVLRGGGLSMKRIAAELDEDEEQVRQWVSPRRTKKSSPRKEKGR